jgi:hypothetical protein
MLDMGCSLLAANIGTVRLCFCFVEFSGCTDSLVSVLWRFAVKWCIIWVSKF